MPRAKLKKFKEIAERENVLEDDKPIYKYLSGNWNQLYFKNDNPITVEMGCGKGEYSVGLAKINPEDNFIGVDVKGDRLWAGSTLSIEEGLKNTGFLRTQIQQIDQFFAPNEVSNIWITFPDPRPRDGDIKRRLTSPRYLKMYKSILKNDGWVYLKTDSDKLFEYTLELLKEQNDVRDLAHTFDLYDSEYVDEHHGIQTTFEQKYLAQGIKIKYLKFRFD